MSRIDETIQAKKDKRAQLEAQGVVAHPYSFDKTHTVAAARQALDEEVKTAGRIMSKREHGKVTFLTIQDHTASIQVLIKEETVGSEWYSRLSLIDPSDYIGVEGTVITTKTGEITVEARELTVLSKALRSIPTSWQSIEDKEVRFRKRYLDMLINPDTKRVLDARWMIEKEIRRYLQDAHQFTEVETPVLQPLYGGTNAKPFMTHMNALDSDFYLRIAPELYLKRLIVGGYERIFEIARNFRNEGIDQTHQPEFTMMEWYMAYTDYNGIMDVAEGLFKHLCEKLYGNLELSVGGTTISLEGNWPRLKMSEALQKYNDIDVNQLNDEQLQQQLTTNNVELTGSFSRGKAVFSLFDKLTTKLLVNPVWIIDYPKEVSPLAKQHRANDQLVERFELYIGTKEMADGWSEITDALEQRARFENEQKNMREGDEEAQPLDEDFLEAMEYGMPPLGGIGIGIDRLVMFLTNTWSIRETIAFPTLRPTAAQLAMSAKMQSSSTKKHATEHDKHGIDLSREKAEALVHSLVENPGLRAHMVAVENCMRGLWSYFEEKQPANVSETQDTWELVGLLHDADWEKTESMPDRHTFLLSEELQKLNVPDWFADSIRSHNFEHTTNQRGPQSLMEWSLYACDHMSGIIVACALVSPDKKLANVTIERILKKFKEKSFAKGATRDEILKGIEHLNIDLQTLASICLTAMQNNASKLGL
ncbi:lysine--tRNA ligase [Candidatus Cerribacteria bacterium 'Amazon FNV 2010 28 9']|uniref:Lysine--tRNA ligase n=1 Tax=Candidatus Cerribacteria bacterium 'Amazon FNV 2010 28 9' TaxID=2081795 RepID=A0A317JRC2_9BACT|nr:MAG: lysine--tRNA ligase [Candidatus Cerribacteria bacterium 'Amazon FNV 2010 28 9']